MVQETPLHSGHLRRMLSELGAIIHPPVNTFYSYPQHMIDLVEYTAIRVLDMFGIFVESAGSWKGVEIRR